MKLRKGRLLLGAVFFLLAPALLWYVPLPRIVLLRLSRQPKTTAFIDARRAELRRDGKSDRIERVPVPLASVSPNLVRAVLAAEDARFYGHNGIDWDAIQEARAYNRRHAKGRHPRLRGASTITQQLAKNLYLSGDRTLWRKAREAAIAVALEAVLSKRRILECYLSAIELGPRTYGCEAAARRYFGKPASRLSEGEAAWLAAMIPGPRVFLSHPARHQKRAARLQVLLARSRGDIPELPDVDEDERE